MKVLLNYSIASYYTENDRNNCNDEKNVNDVAHSKACESEIADQPENDQNDGYCIQKISHFI